MTLIVCKIIGDDLIVHGDTRVVNATFEPGKFEVQKNTYGVLKIVIIEPRICIAYAGTIEYAEEAISKCLEQKVDAKDGDALKILEILKKITLEHPEDITFALGIISNKGPILAKISKGNVEMYNDSLLAFGDSRAVDFFKEKYDSLKTEKDAIGKAFDDVIKNSNIESVGDYHLSLHIDREICLQLPVFLYDIRLEINLQPGTIKLEANMWTGIPLGKDPQGISVFRTVSPDYHGIGIHSIYDNSGIFLCPQIGKLGDVFEKLQGQQIKLSGKEFIDMIKEKHGVPMQGFDKSDGSAVIFLDNRDLDNIKT